MSGSNSPHTFKQADQSSHMHQRLRPYCTEIMLLRLDKTKLQLPRRYCLGKFGVLLRIFTLSSGVLQVLFILQALKQPQHISVAAQEGIPFCLHHVWFQSNLFPFPQPTLLELGSHRLTYSYVPQKENGGLLGRHPII